MKELFEHPSIWAGVFAFVIIAMSIVILYWIVRERKKQKKLKRNLETQYRLKYIYIQDLLADFVFNKAITHANYDILHSHILELGQMVYKNKEKTCTLSLEIFRTFQDVCKEDIESLNNKYWNSSKTYQK